LSDRIVNTNGVALHIMEVGAGEPAVVFLHYWGGSSRTWRKVIERLRGSPQVIAIDQRGWGGSVVTDGRYDLAAMADDTLAVARVLGLSRYVLIGHSMGGKVAQIVAARRPEGLAGHGPDRTRSTDADAGVTRTTRRYAGILRLA
jgi:pimeloyl-ACP methyl ester carboxylesterase